MIPDYIVFLVAALLITYLFVFVARGIYTPKLILNWLKVNESSRGVKTVGAVIILLTFIFAFVDAGASELKANVGFGIDYSIKSNSPQCDFDKDASYLYIEGEYKREDISLRGGRYHASCAGGSDALVIDSWYVGGYYYWGDMVRAGLSIHKEDNRAEFTDFSVQLINFQYGKARVIPFYSIQNCLSGECKNDQGVGLIAAYEIFIF